MPVPKGRKKSSQAGLEVRERNLSDLWKPGKIAALVLSDLHNRIDSPAARAEKGDRWLPVLKGYYDQVKEAMYAIWPDIDNAIVLYTGDIFHDGWRVLDDGKRRRGCPPELINFVLENMPPGIGIPGQHDLPHHDLNQINKSAYWTLVSAGHLVHINRLEQHRVRKIVDFYGTSWGEKIEKRMLPSDDRKSVMLMHRYVWKDGHVHPGAEDKDNVHCVQSDLQRLGYTHGIAGDNHSGFLDDNFLVPGAFYRSRADEVDYKPAIGAIYEDGTIVRYFLDVSNDEFVDDRQLAQLLTSRETDTSELVEALQNYKKVSSDFFEMVEFYAKKMRASSQVKQIITQIKDKANGDKK